MPRKYLPRSDRLDACLRDILNAASLIREEMDYSLAHLAEKYPEEAVAAGLDILSFQLTVLDNKYKALKRFQAAGYKLSDAYAGK